MPHFDTFSIFHFYRNEQNNDIIFKQPWITTTWPQIQDVLRLKKKQKFHFSNYNCHLIGVPKTYYFCTNCTMFRNFSRSVLIQQWTQKLSRNTIIRLIIALWLFQLCSLFTSFWGIWNTMGYLIIFHLDLLVYLF